jgi:hypothetical protein
MDLLRLKINRDPKAVLSILLQLSLLIISVSYALLYPPNADATVTSFYLRLDRQSATAALSGVVCLNTTSVATENKMIVSFPSTFSLNASSWTVDTTVANLPSGATQWPSIAGPTIVDTATNAAIFTTGNLTNGTNYCFHFTGGTSNVGTAGNNELGQIWTSNVTAGGTTTNIDNANYATSIVAGINGEQVAVTASISGTFTFSLSPTAPIYGQTLPLGILTNAAGGNTAPNQIQASITTNAHNGYFAWLKSANAKLHSTQVGAGSDISSTTGDLASATGYGAFAWSSTATIASPYNSTPTTGNGTAVGLLHSTQFDQIASEATAPIVAHTFNVGVRARLSGTELPATDYTDTLTLVASGSF